MPNPPPPQKPAFSFGRANDPMNFLLQVFGTLQREEATREVTVVNNVITITNRSEEERTLFNFDRTVVENRYFNWLHTTEPVLNYTHAESDILRLCIHAAYYFFTEREGQVDPNNPFIVYYNYLNESGGL